MSLPFSSESRRKKQRLKRETQQNQTLILAAMDAKLPAGTPGVGYTYIAPQYQELVAQASSSLVTDWDNPDTRRKIMGSCAWAYENVAHVWTGFNTIAETCVKAVVLKKDAPNEAKSFWKRETKARTQQLLILNSLKFGSAIFEPNSMGFKVRDTRDFEWIQNSNGTIRNIHQRLDILGGFDKPVDKEKVKFFVLHPRFSDDSYGVPAAKPALPDINILRGMINQGWKAFKSYAAPIIWIQTPVGTGLADRQDIQNQLRTFKIDTRMVLPPGCEIKSVFEKGQFVYTDLRKMIREQLVTAMGVGQISLGITEGSNRATSHEERGALYDRVQPAAELLATTLSDEFDLIYKKGGDNFIVQELSAEDVLRKANADWKLSNSVWRLQQAMDSPNCPPVVKAELEKRILSLLKMETARSV